jgi:hypothetical protein
MTGEALGKLSDDALLSCSQLPAIAGRSPYATPNDVLIRASQVRQARANNLPDPPRESAGEAAAWGNKLEKTILQEAADRLGLDVQLAVTEAVRHAELPLQGSLDGILWGDGRVVEHDPTAGIYVVGADRIALQGPGVLEAKATRVRPLDEPADYRGPIQVQGLMMCCGYTWGAIATLYQGSELRIYLVGPDFATQEKIRQDCLDFEERLGVWARDGVMDYYPVFSPNDAQQTFARAEDDLPAVELDSELSQLALDLLAARAAIKQMQDLAKACQTRIMDAMGLHTQAIARDEAGEVVATVSWGMQAARKGYTVAAKPPARAASLKVEEVSNE